MKTHLKNFGRIGLIGLVGLLAATTAWPAAGQTSSQLYSQSADGSFVPVALDTNGSAPTLTGPLVNLLTTMAAWTNIAVAPYGIYDTGTKQYGAGLLALYNANSYMAGGIAVQYLNKEVWMPSAQFQLQAPLTIGGKFTVTPLAFTGLGTPVSGRASDNGTPVGIFGAGLGVKLYGSPTANHLDAFFAVAKWTGFEGEQWYMGLAYRF